MSDQTTNDPLESADNPQIPSRVVFGQVALDAYFCVLEKGTGKRLFDPQSDPAGRRRTNLTISITPVAVSGKTKPWTREAIAESVEWHNISLASLRALNRRTADLRGAWVKAELVADGRKFADKTTGEMRDSLAWKFHAFYADEAACSRAYEVERGLVANDVPDLSTHPVGGATPAPDPAVAMERQVALQFVKALIPMHKTNLNALATQMAGMPQIAKYFTLDSPEVQRLLAEAVA